MGVESRNRLGPLLGKRPPHNCKIRFPMAVSTGEGARRLPVTTGRNLSARTLEIVNGHGLVRWCCAALSGAAEAGPELAGAVHFERTLDDGS